MTRFIQKDGIQHKIPQIGSVVIEDNVWIGTNSVILKGVAIGRGSVVSANSLVTRSIPSYSIAMGVPAKIVISGIDRISQSKNALGEKETQVTKYLNLGFERGQYYILSDKQDPRSQDYFDAFSPKVLAMREPFHDNATEGRLLSVSNA
jgi:acyl-[acyl carrier protein]--UDP-N-acetylglucosamine O-acyltransferase